MDREYEINMKKLRKQRDEAKRAQQQKVKKESQQSRAAQLAQGYTFKNPQWNQKFTKN